MNARRFVLGLLGIGESKDLASQQPEVAARSKAAYLAWNKDNIAPLFQSPAGGKAKAKSQPSQQRRSRN